VIVAAFAVAVGHLAWHTFVGPSVTPKYFVGGAMPALAGRDPDAKHLYLRRELYLSRPPQHAWLQVIGQDRLNVYANGELVAEKALDGFPVAVLADITAYLRPGVNVIAIAAAQATVGRPPVVAVDGAYLLDDGEHRITPDECWRCRTVFERGAAWWFSPDFKDRHWDIAQQTTANLRAAITVPPGAITTPSKARWITPGSWADGSAGVRRAFDIPRRPCQAWLRVTASSSYRLAVNGILLDEQEEQLGTTTPVPPVRRTYDITSVVQRGRNCLAFVLTSAAGPPHLQADLEVEDQSGQLTSVKTDEGWLSRPGLPADWLDAEPEDVTAWQPCAVEAGELGMLPWQVRSKVMEISLPFFVLLWRGLGQVGLMVFIGLLTWRLSPGGATVGSQGREPLEEAETSAAQPRRGDSNPTGAGTSAAPPGLNRDMTPLSRGSRPWLPTAAPPGLSWQTAAPLVLVPPTVLIATGLLATYDPRFGAQDVYCGLWLFLAIALVPLQWLILRRFSKKGDAALFHEKELRPLFWNGRRAELVLLSLLLLAGFWLRYRHLETEPMHWDEVEVYRNTIGFLEHGFPSIEVHPDAPRLKIHTSELLFVSTGLAALVFEDDRYVVRVPSLCWGVLTILLVYRIGRRLFGVPAGLIAAAVLTFAPVCIAMCTFGRYFAQLQFLTLLTVSCFWQTIQGSGPISRGALWATAVSFIAMFLTWEGSALIAPAMVLAALLQRRGRLRTIFGNGDVWLALLAVLAAVLLQHIHLMRVQSQFLWLGISLSDVTLKPMWPLPIFEPWYYVWESSWNSDAFLPMLGLLGAALLTIRHPLRRPIRFLMPIYLGDCLMMALWLPNLKWRYIHQVIPFVILLASAALAALLRALVQSARPSGPARWYAQAVALGVAVAAIALGSGLTVRLVDMPRFAVEGYSRLATFQFPNIDGPAQFLRRHLQEGDVVLSHDLQHLHHVMQLPGPADGRPEPDRPLDYWLETTLFLPAMLDDHRDLPLDRRDGSVLIPNRASLEDLFARHRRIWYVAQPGIHQAMNTAEVSSFLRQHMEVVYEDWQTLVLFRGDHHRTLGQRQRDEKALQKARAIFLP
jgi:hypothetical protein